MRRKICWAGTLLAVGTAVWCGGCASQDHSGHERHSAMAGMECPKCETIWVKPSMAAQGSKVTALRWGREEVCPDCDAMAEAYLKDGKAVLHDCPTCKVTPRPATPVEPAHAKGTHS